MKTNKEIKYAAIEANPRYKSGFTNEQKWMDEHRDTKISGFIQGAEWMQNQQNEWVDINKLLPPFNVRVLCLFSDDTPYVYTLKQGQYGEPLMDFYWELYPGSKTHFKDIKYWMFIPDQPK